jgi:hypothetical protein
MKINKTSHGPQLEEVRKGSFKSSPQANIKVIKCQLDTLKTLEWNPLGSMNMIFKLV